MGGCREFACCLAQALLIDRMRERPPTKVASRWRSQFAPKPAYCFNSARISLGNITRTVRLRKEGWCAYCPKDRVFKFDA
jgi:hypothetical protein